MLTSTLTGLNTAEFPEMNLFEQHRVLAKWNQTRITPRIVNQNWRSELQEEKQMLLLEGEILEFERAQIARDAAKAPHDAAPFMKWFEALKENGPGQHDSLFDALEESASLEQMRWFIHQELAGEAGFDDLTALTQVKMPTQPKLEIARNYWDEMGRGQVRGMHGPMLEDVGRELNITNIELDSVVTESLALGNILLGLAMNRRYAYHSVGALGAVELTAPGRAEKVYKGLNRLGVSPQGQRYYLLHSALDVKHSQTWNAEVIYPLVKENPELTTPIAEGALMRLHAGARCFVLYREILGLDFRLHH